MSRLLYLVCSVLLIAELSRCSSDTSPVAGSFCINADSLKEDSIRRGLISSSLNDSSYRVDLIDKRYDPYIKRNDSLIIYENIGYTVYPLKHDTELFSNMTFVDLKRKNYSAKEFKDIREEVRTTNFPEARTELKKYATSNCSWFNGSYWVELAKYKNEYYVLDVERSYMLFDTNYIFIYGQNAMGLAYAVSKFNRSREIYNADLYLYGVADEGHPKCSMKLRYLEPKRNILLVRSFNTSSNDEWISAWAPLDSICNYRHMYTFLKVGKGYVRPEYECEFDKLKWKGDQ